MRDAAVCVFQKDCPQNIHGTDDFLLKSRCLLFFCLGNKDTVSVCKKAVGLGTGGFFGFLSEYPLIQDSVQFPYIVGTEQPPGCSSGGGGVMEIQRLGDFSGPVFVEFIGGDDNPGIQLVGFDDFLGEGQIFPGGGGLFFFIKAVFIDSVGGEIAVHAFCFGHDFIGPLTAGKDAAGFGIFLQISAGGFEAFAQHPAGVVAFDLASEDDHGSSGFGGCVGGGFYHQTGFYRDQNEDEKKAGGHQIRENPAGKLATKPF